MIAKLKKQGLQTDCGTALKEMHDAVGVRIVSSFVEDVYAVAEWLQVKEEIASMDMPMQAIWDFIRNEMAESNSRTD